MIAARSGQFTQKIGKVEEVSKATYIDTHVTKNSFQSFVGLIHYNTQRVRSEKRAMIAIDRQQSVGKRLEAAKMMCEHWEIAEKGL